MINLQFVADYVKYRLGAKTRHGVHSPFVYQLVDEIIYDFRAKENYQDIEALRRLLLADKRYLNLTDLGAGSHINKNKRKQVKSLAKDELKSEKLAQLIYRLARHFSPCSILELGTCLGLTTAYLAKATPSAKVISIEGCPETAAIAAENFKQLGLQNVELKVGSFDDLLPGVIAGMKSLDLVFIDGNHRKEATLDYFNQCLPKLSTNGLMIFDDIYWSRGMKEAWQLIKDHPQVSVTIDLFWIGLVFIRPGQAKEHFKIRF